MGTQATARKPRIKCVHHWVIEPPNGRASTGACKHCGRKRSFPNSTESVMWEQTNTLRSDPNANPLRSSVRIPRPSEMRLSDEN